MSKQTIEKISKDLTNFHKYILIPFDKTSMTIPSILYYAISTKYENPRAYFKDLASKIKSDIIASGVSTGELQGKLSRKVQEIAWCEIIYKAKISDVSLTDFSGAKVVPYGENEEKTTMTVPIFLFRLIQQKHGGNVRKANKYIRERAEEIKSQIISECGESALKGKVSHKIQENLWLEFIPEKVKNTPIDLVA